MTKKKTEAMIACLMTVCMLLGICPGITLTAGAAPDPITVVSTSYNTNQGDGITLFKNAAPRGDGTVDVSIGAYSTGAVMARNMMPADITLVLDVSESMNDDAAAVIGGEPGQKKIDVLKADAKAFIDATAEMNASIKNQSQMHRIAIIKYADNSYFDGNSAIQTPSLIEGNHQNGTGGNYTQVVKALIPVTAENATVLKNAIDSLAAGGASAIDYGIRLASTLMENSESSDTTVKRTSAVIAFADGEPTHESGFDTTVANSALSYANTLKNDVGAYVYSVSMAADADASTLGNLSNQFMHYLSDNYLHATSMSTPDMGDISAGYYLTPSEDQSLESILTDIFLSISSQQIDMSVGTSLTDTISAYFELVNGTNSVSLKTVAKTANGWAAEGEEDVKLSYSLSSDQKTFTVTGFNFDENYISETARGANGDFYGKMLLLQLNVKPINSIIDAGAVAHNGTVPTNTGTAFLTDFEGIVRAEVDSPRLTLPKVTYSYTVNGENKTEYASYYRLPANELTVIDNAPSTQGYTFSGWTTSDAVVSDVTNSYIMPNANVEFTGDFAPSTHKVTYVFDGVAPSGAVLPDEKTYDYGTTVQVEDVPSVPGYDFSGWYSDVITVTNNEITMPANDVVFYGSFSPRNDTEYRVEYYLQNLEDDGYTLDAEAGYTGTGTTGTTVYADRKAYTGFTFNPEQTNNRDYGVIAGDGSLVLQVYLNRNTYDVTYSYTGNVPAIATPSRDDLLDYTETYKYGATVTVRDKATADGYIFTGWYRVDAARASDDESSVSSFTMPDAPVELRGYFSPVEEGADYTISHYLQDVEDENSYTQDGNATTLQGIAGQTATATERHYSGFDFNPDKSTVSDVIAADGSLELKLYYDRKSFNVSYEIEGETYGAVAPTATPQKYGATVQVDSSMVIPVGYSFSGWTTSDVSVADNEFKVPAHDVKLLGYLTPKTVTWKEEHYLQKIDGSGYDLDDTPTGNITHNNTTGATIQTSAGHYPGFELNTAETDAANPSALVDEIVETTVLGDGSLVLKFYYDRLSYDVTYRFTGMVPTAVHEKRPDYEKTIPVPFGKNVAVPVIPEADYQGFSFSGWTTTDAVVTNGSFDMPSNNVTLTSSFTPELNEYKVRHLLENLPGDNSGIQNAANSKYYTVAETEVFNDKRTGALVEAVPKNHTGFSPITTGSELTASIVADGSLVIDVYYDRHLFNVTYEYSDDGSLPDNPPVIPAEYAKTSVPFGTKLTVEDGLVLDGYIFNGWSTTNATVSEESGVSVYTMPNNDVVFRGGFTKTYTVRYSLNSGTGASGVDYSDKTVAEGSSITLNAAPTRTGYTFTGWNDGTTNHAAGATVTVNNDMTFTAQWSRNGGNNYGGGGGGAVTYTLTYDSNGGTAFEKEKYTSGKVVTLTNVPEKDGYIFDGWHLDKELAEDASEVKMSKNITVYAAWIEDDGSANAGNENPGSDSAVPESLNGEERIAYVEGYPDGTVRPGNNITRAEVTTIFFRLLKDSVRDENTSNFNSFDDVNDGDWYNTAISTMANLGIIKGRSFDRFAPGEFITRAEFAAICARFVDSEFEATDSFTDIKGHWAEADIREVAAYGWITGYEDNTFKPDRFITRAEAMAIINRILNRVPETLDDLPSDMLTWSDNSDTSAWYYIPVQEATNGQE